MANTLYDFARQRFLEAFALKPTKETRFSY